MAELIEMDGILKPIVNCLNTTIMAETSKFKKVQFIDVTTHPFTIEVGVLSLPDHFGGPSCKCDLDGDEWIVTHCGH